MHNPTFRSTGNGHRSGRHMAIDDTVSPAGRVVVGSEGVQIPRLLLCLHQDDTAATTERYARYVRDLLGGQIIPLCLTPANEVADIKRVARSCDLIIYDESEPTLLARLLGIHSGHRALIQMPTSILLARQPRWPINQILLIARTEATDEAAVQWAGRLARAASARVTILAIVPPLPALYRQSTLVQPTMDVLLAPNTSSGQRLRHISQQMAQWQVAGRLRLRQGEPDWQIRQEVEEGSHDLIVIAAEPVGRWRRWLMGELVTPLLHWVDRPVLIAKPALSIGGD